jgi:formylglycine-generating enzyme required for sulfatase activity
MRLCRAVRSAAVVTSDEWGFACQGGQTCAAAYYPYACGYSASACNGADHGLASAAACGSLASCATVGDLDTASTNDKVFDLSGNLAEWTDDRRDIPDTAGSPAGAGTESAIYTLRGGAFDSFFGGMACDFMGTQVHPNFAFADTGFRCCSSCPSGQADCGGACKSLGSDSANCGACGTACGAGTTCQNGACK